MEESRFLQDLWMSISLDAQLRIKEVQNPDSTLFFGICPEKGNELADSFSNNEKDRQQFARITEGIERAVREKRIVFLTYYSSIGEDEIPISMFIECGENEVRLYATAINADDMQRVQEVSTTVNVPPTVVKTSTTVTENFNLNHTLFEYLPVGLEVYDANGRLIEVNSQELNAMGIADKKDVLGLNLFENPNFPPDARTKLLAGENVHFLSDYDFSKAVEAGYYPTTKVGNSLLSVSITVIRSSVGEIENYLLISQDITERTEYQQKYETLYNQNMTILNSLPVGVEIYSPDGKLNFLTEADCRIFGVDQQEVLAMNLSIDDNPNLPLEVKEAVHKGLPVQSRFIYRYEAVAEKEYYHSSLQRPILHIECTGQPVIGPDGMIQNYVFIVQDVTEDVCHEEELRQSKRKIEIATKDAEIILWEFDVYKQIFFSENDQLTGYDNTHPITVAECTGFFYAEDQIVVSEYIQRMISGEDFSFTLDVRLTFPGSNELQYCTFSGIPYERDASGKVTRFVGSRKNNTELQRRKILQDNILNSIPIPIHIKDLDNDSCYVFCNEESTRMFGTSIGGSIYDVMNEAQVARVEKTDKEVFSTGKPYFGVERIELLNGQSYDVLVRKSVIYDGNKRLLLNVRWDQSLQNDLQRRAKVLSLSMQAMNAYTWFYDPEKNRVSFGEGFERMGRNAQMLNTRETFAVFIHPDDRQLFIDTQVEQLEKDSGEWVVEYRIDLEGTGNYEWWETRGIIETTVIDDIPHKFMLGMSVSIDSHKRIELELRDAKARAEQSDKLKSAFLANMSHEIRTPLNAIVGFSDLLMNTDELEDREEYMRIISNNTELLLKLIGDILDLSKIESGAIELKYEEFDLSHFFNDMTTSMKQRATKPGVELIDRNPYEKCIVYLDRNRIAQIMTNYVTNAIKYTPKGFIEMGYEAVDKGIRFYVKDTGIGIADEKKNKVFQRFEKLDEFAQGTGLGLSICKAIAESMGGSVGFDSMYNEGSLFWAILPCKPHVSSSED
ncbi:ATP-binding protein [Bacteroides sp.]|uniref:PAS domain-containing sensor histidine kinase n=1 Tax=Bacteroides sp. TaxID=29523 RepID=UPI00260514A8|nr:ATP-binding protein [Bacteroides sp.]